MDPKYNPNTPTVTLTFDQWQEQFLVNFQKMSEAFSENHLPLEDASLSGNHTVIQLVEQEKDTKLQTNIGDFALFTRLVESQTDQVSLQGQGNSPEAQYTNYQIYDIPDIKDNKGNVIQTLAFTSLPGGLMVYFGSILQPSLIGKGAKSTIRLIPSICKNIVSVTNTIIGTSGGFNQDTATVIKDKDEKYVISIDMIVSQNFVEYYYLVVGNI